MITLIFDDYIVFGSISSTTSLSISSGANLSFTLTLKINAVFTLCIHVGVTSYQLYPIFTIQHSNNHYIVAFCVLHDYCCVFVLSRLVLLVLQYRYIFVYHSVTSFYC